MVGLRGEVPRPGRRSDQALALDGPIERSETAVAAGSAPIAEGVARMDLHPREEARARAKEITVPMPTARRGTRVGPVRRRPRPDEAGPLRPHRRPRPLQPSPIRRIRERARPLRPRLGPTPRRDSGRGPEDPTGRRHVSSATAAVRPARAGAGPARRGGRLAIRLRHVDTAARHGAAEADPRRIAATVRKSSRWRLARVASRRRRPSYSLLSARRTGLGGNRLS